MSILLAFVVEQGYCEPYGKLGDMPPRRLQKHKPQFRGVFEAELGYSILTGEKHLEVGGKTSTTGLYGTGRRLNFMAENWVDDRDKAILETIYYCENCNLVLDLGDNEVQQHKKELPSHKMRKVFIVRCRRCGNIVTDSHAQYSPERNQFWCKNCIAETGVASFHST